MSGESNKGKGKFNNGSTNPVPEGREGVVLVDVVQWGLFTGPPVIGGRAEGNEARTTSEFGYSPGSSVLPRERVVGLSALCQCVGNGGGTSEPWEMRDWEK